MRIGSVATVMVVLTGCTEASSASGERASLAETGQMPVLFVRQDDRITQSPEKLALIVAIGEQGAPQQGAKAYKRLDGPPNDVGLVSDALQHHGFREDNILTLRDEQASRDGILRALESLIDRADTGDVAVFYYAGHGHQITDDDANEELDGYDEVLVPYGAPDHSQSTDEVQAAYSGDDHIRDDTLGVLFDRLQAKVGSDGNVAVFLDACFSGTGTRGGFQLAARGGAGPIGPPAVAGNGGGNLLGGGFAEAPSAGGPRARGGDELRYVVISAASHDELAWETYHTDGETPVGPLAHALSLALPKMRTGNSYRELHSQIVAITRNTRRPQSPQIEGPADTEVFGNQLIDYEPWVLVRSDEGDGRLELDGGELRGLGRDSEVEIRASMGADDPDALLATGRVVDPHPLWSVVELDSLPSNVQFDGARAFVTRESFGDLTTKIAIAETMDPRYAENIRNALDSVWIVSVVTGSVAGADGILVQNDSGLVQLTTPHNEMPVGDPLPLDAIHNHVAQFARNVYLRKLRPDDASIDVTLSLHPGTLVKNRVDACPSSPESVVDTTRYVNAERLIARNADWRILYEERRPSELPNEGYYLRVSNNGESEVHFAILSLMSDGNIKLLYPKGLVTPAEAKLRARQTLTVPDCFVVTNSPGIDEIKLFATREPVDFAPLLAAPRRTVGSRGDSEQHDLERLLTETYRPTRSESIGGKPSGTSISSILIDVVVNKQ